jgi:hypothetical protein
MKSKTKRANKNFDFNIKWFVVNFIFILAIILIFAFFDYLTHSLSPDYSVPSYYFTNKVIYGTFWGLIICYFVRKQKLIKKSLILSAGVSGLLQIRYFLEGYPTDFVVEFLFIHFAILFLVSLFVFGVFKSFLAKF